MYIQVIMQTEQVVFIYLGIYRHIYVCIIYDKRNRGHVFEREQEGYRGMVEMKKEKGGMMQLYFSLINK